MVHIGAIVASQISCIKLACTRHLSDLRMPDAQRIWVGMGTAAGVAAAFQAPVGGVLYAFEEVCSNWTSVLTWRAFACVVVASFTMSAVTALLPEAFTEIYQIGGLSLGLEGEAKNISSCVLRPSEPPFHLLRTAWCSAARVMDGARQLGKHWCQ